MKGLKLAYLFMFAILLIVISLMPLSAVNLDNISDTALVGDQGNETANGVQKIIILLLLQQK